MRVVYENPPIFEAYCRIGFDPSDASDPTIPGLLFQALESTLPVKELEEDVSMSPHAPFMRFLSADGRYALRLGIDQFSFHSLENYGGWGEYKSLIAEILATYLQVAKPEAIDNVVLSYTNRIVIPGAHADSEWIRVANYIKAFPNSPPAIMNSALSAGFNQTIEAVFPEGVLRLYTATTAVESDKGEVGAFVMRIEFKSPPAGKLKREKFDDWVEFAHSKIEETFLISVTPEAEALFGKKTYE